MRKKLIITGGAGFIGSQLANLCAVNGHDVVVIDSLLHHTSDYLVVPSIELIESDLNSIKNYEQLLSDVDAVIHLAASGNVIDSIENPLENFHNNVVSTLKLLEEMRHSQCRRLFFSSTGGALMGDTTPPVTENSLPAPISPYGSSKLACEGYIRGYSNCYNIDSTIFRFANVFGPNCRHKSGVLQKFYQAVISGTDLEIYGNASRDFIYSIDLIDLIYKIVKNDMLKNEVLLLASGNEVKIYDLAEKIKKFSTNSKTQIIQKLHRKGEVVNNYADIDKLRLNLPGFEFTAFDDALYETLKYMKGEV
jgi:UDP-glucose 4-epimerase